MHFRKVICLGGLIALTGCCHTVPTNEFVDPRFNLTLLPYSRGAWRTTLRPAEIKQSNDKGSIITAPCVLIENEMGFVRFQCRHSSDSDVLCQKKNCPLTDISYRVVDNIYLQEREVGIKREIFTVGSPQFVSQTWYYISNESMDLLRDKEAACALEK